MKILYFDCFAGISGDMILGSLINLGLNLEALSAELRKLPLDGYRLEATHTRKAGIQATQFRVILVNSQGEHLADSEFQEEELPVDAPDAHGHHHEIQKHAAHPQGSHQPRGLKRS